MLPMRQFEMRPPVRPGQEGPAAQGPQSTLMPAQPAFREALQPQQAVRPFSQIGAPGMRFSSRMPLTL